MRKHFTLFLLFASSLLHSQEVQWAGNIGGAMMDNAPASAMDAAGNLYVTGFFMGTADMDPGSGVTEISVAGSGDLFIVKLDPEGDLVWVYTCGDPSGNASGLSIAVAPSGQVYVTGTVFGTMDFDPGAGVAQLSAPSSYDTFILKLGNDGSFIWARSFEGIDMDSPSAITLDANENVYTTGYFYESVDFDPGEGESMIASDGGPDMFVAALDSDGNFLWASHIGGGNFQYGGWIDTDASGNVYTTGYFHGTTDFDPGEGSVLVEGNEDTFICKLTSTGELAWVKPFTGTLDTDLGTCLHVDDFGDVYAGGYFAGTVDFDPGPLEFEMTVPSGYDLFLAKLDTDGNFIWAKHIAGLAIEYVACIDSDDDGNIYHCGVFNGQVDFDPGPGENLITAAGAQDAYIQKLTSNGDHIWTRALGGTTDDVFYSVNAGPGNAVYATGQTEADGDFDPGPANVQLENSGEVDAVIVKIDNPAGVEQPTVKNEFDIYPNPATNSIMVAGKTLHSGTRYEVVDALGRSVLSGKMQGPQTAINIEGLESGMYYLYAEGGCCAFEKN